MMYRNPRRGLIAALLLAGSGAAAFDDTLPPALEPLPEAAIFAGSANPAMRFRKLGLLARENGDPARAAEFFRCALREDGAENGRPELRDLLHESLLDCGRPEEAAEVLAEAAAAPDMRENLLTAVMTARRNFYAGQKKEARALLEETLRRNGTAAGTARVRALELLARVRNALGDYEEAARSFAELAAWTKEDPPLHWRVLSAAVLNALDGRRNEQAAELLERIETELPESFRRRHHGRIARLRLLADAEQGRFREVEPQYDAMLATARVPDALLGRIAGILARAHAERGEWPRAAELWAAAVKFGDEWFRASALLELMECEAAGGMTERALETLKRYLALYPDAEGRNRLALFEASLHRKLDHSEAADELLRKVYRESGDTGERRLAALELARSAWRAGRSDEAVAMLTFAAANAADAEQRRKIEQRLGECLYRLGRFEEAVKLFAGAAAGSAGAEKETPTGAARLPLCVGGKAGRLRRFRDAGGGRG